MKRKWSTLSVSLVLAFSLVLSACGSNNNNAGGETSKEKTKTVTVFQFKTEIVEGLNELAVEFNKQYPNIKLDIQTVGGGADYGASLKTKFAAGDAPDIFSNGGFAEMEMWFDKLEDLSDQSWVKDLVPLAAEPMTKDGKVYGMAMNLEGIGYVYNKDAFAKAGITTLPKTYSELEAAAKTLKESGITPFANGYQEWWLVGNQGINPAFAQQPDVNAFIAGLNDGTATITGNQKFADWIKLYKLTVDYGNKNPLTTDASTQVSLFANGEAAMMQQGNWSQAQIDAINPDLNIGMLPMPLGEDAEANDKLNVGIPANLVVNKDSDVKEEAKIFLNWLVTSDIGKEYIVKKFKFIPALSTIPATPEDMGDIGAEVYDYVQAGKVLSLQSSKYPDGVTQEFASVIQQFIAGRIDENGWMTSMQTAWDKMKK